MKQRVYLGIAGALFGLISILHFLRLATGTVVVVGGKEVSFAVSWVGGIVTLTLAVWGLMMAAGRAR